MWSYIFFFIHLNGTKVNDYTALEMYVYKLVSISDDVRLQTGEWAVYKLVSIPDNVRLLTGENGVYTLVSIPDDVLYKLVNMEFIRW